METKTKIGAFAAVLLAIIIGSTIVLTPTGKSDWCVKSDVWGEWEYTAQPYLYYCVPEDKYEWCINIFDVSYGGLHERAGCTVAEINETIPPQNISMAEWVELPKGVRVWANLSCRLDGKVVYFEVDEPDADIDTDDIKRILGSGLISNCTVINSTLEELINKTMLMNLEGKISFFRDRLETKFNITETNVTKGEKI